MRSPARHSPVEAAELLQKADQFCRTSRLAVDENPDVAADLAALAAIVAADAVCCIRIGERSTAPAHRNAPRLLLEADADADDPARVLDGLVHLHNRERQGTPLTKAEVRRVVSRAARFVEYAMRLATGSRGRVSQAPAPLAGRAAGAGAPGANA